MNNTYNLKKFIMEAIEELGFKDYTKIQQSVIPLALSNKSIVAKSQTGTGKTHSFLLPIFNKIDFDLKEVQVVVVAPTRELAEQIYEVASQIASKNSKELLIKLYTGGTDRKKEVSFLENSQPQFVIATPGKLFDLAIKTKVLELHTTKTFVIDEADMSLDGGFIEELHEIASIMPENLQLMTFSATMTQELEVFLNKYMKKPEFVYIDSKQLSSLNITHELVKTKYSKKYPLLLDLLQNLNPYLCLIFTNTKTSCVALADKLKEDGLSVVQIHGDLPIRVRKQNMRKIKNLEYTYIVCTDIAARGIDIDDVSHVINYELPNDVEFYVHRSGRTGRALKQGITLSFYEFEDYTYLDKLETLGIKFNFAQIKNGELVESSDRNRRQKRVVTDDSVLKQAKKMVKVKREVKPAYKKKYNYKLNEAKQKLRRKKKRK